MTGIGLARRPGETWLQAAIRLARPYGLEIKVRDHYQAARLLGVSEEEAAFGAVMEWDVADLQELDA